MTKIIAVSGTHSTGKTTLLNALKGVSENIIIDDYKVARAVQNELGIANLEDITKSIHSIMEFQELVLERKYDHDKLLADSGNCVIFVERSFFDILSYTRLWYEALPSRVIQDYRSWFKDYSTRAVEKHSIYDGHVMLFADPKIPYEADPNRASVASRKQLEQLLITYDITFSKIVTRRDPEYRYHTLNVYPSDLTTRAELLTEFANSLL